MARVWAGMTQAGQAQHGPPCQPSMAHKGLGRADGRGQGGDENPTMEEVQERGQRQISEDGGEETEMEKRLWLWILEQRRTEAGKGGGEKKRSDKRSEDDGLGKKQGNGGEEEVGDGTGGCMATMKRRTKTWAECGRWIRQEKNPWAMSWGRRRLKTGRERRCWQWRVKKKGRGWEETGGNTDCFPRF